MMNIGEKIRYYREYRGFSQVQLADFSEINVGTIRKYELGIRKPKPDQIKKIANALQISSSVFLELDITTASDAISLIILLSENLDIEFIKDSNDEESTLIKFKNKHIQDFLKKWSKLYSEYQNSISKVDEITNPEAKSNYINKYSKVYESIKLLSLTNNIVVKKGIDHVSVKTNDF